MYNEERKRGFIRFKQDTTELANNIITCFNDAEIFEEKYGKDLCDWTAPEIVGYLKYINTTKSGTLTVLVNMLRIYTDWCLSNSLVQDHQNHYYEVTQDIIDGCIDTTSLSLSIITREFLLKKLEYVYNAADKFVLLGSFEGVRTMDFPAIKMLDIKGNVLALKKRTIQISDELAEIAAEANIETVYMSPIRRLKIDLGSSEYVLKNKADADEGKIPTTELSIRFHRIMKYLDLSSVTMKDLRESGRIEFIVQLMRESGEPLDKILHTKRDIIEQQYGKIQALSSYINIYGPIIEERMQR